MKQDPPQHEKEVLQYFEESIKKSMSELEYKSLGEIYQVASFKTKRLEVQPWKLAETGETVDVIQIFKNKNLLVTITSTPDEGHGIEISGNLDQNKRTIALTVSDIQGDGIYDHLGQHTYDESGNDIRSFYDENYDGFCESFIDYRTNTVYVRIDGEMKELLVLKGKRYVKDNEELKEIERNENGWGYKTREN